MKFGVDMYTWLYLKQIANEDLCIAQGPCSVFCNNPNGKGIWKRIKINKNVNIEKRKVFPSWWDYKLLNSQISMTFMSYQNIYYKK